jgi:hypothetical protein
MIKSSKCPEKGNPIKPLFQLESFEDVLMNESEKISC